MIAHWQVLYCYRWSQKESNNLYWYYVQSTKSSDPIGKVVEYYVENAQGAKTRIDVSSIFNTINTIFCNYKSKPFLSS